MAVIATYEDIKKAVFYAHEKPELLANIIADAVGVDVEKPSKGEPSTPEVTE